MRVEIINDKCSYPKGTVLQNVKQTERYYKGLWCSMDGTYNVKIRKDYCKIIKEK